MSIHDDNKAVVGRWFTSFWGQNCELAVVDEVAAPDMLLHYLLHEPRHGRSDIKAFIADFRATSAVQRNDVPTGPEQHSTVEAVNDWVAAEAYDRAHSLEASTLSDCDAARPMHSSHKVPGPATLGDFFASDKAGISPRHEWTATLPDLTRVVVRDCCDAPSVVGIEKAVSIVQSRVCLERRARRLLVPFSKEAGSWRLVTLDFGSEAQRCGCEFLMCFAFGATNGVLSITSPSVEIGFALLSQAATDPIFVLTVVRAVGFPHEDCSLSAR